MNLTRNASIIYKAPQTQRTSKFKPSTTQRNVGRIYSLSRLVSFLFVIYFFNPLNLLARFLFICKAKIHKIRSKIQPKIQKIHAKFKQIYKFSVIANEPQGEVWQSIVKSGFRGLPRKNSLTLIFARNDEWAKIHKFTPFFHKIHKFLFLWIATLVLPHFARNDDNFHTFFPVFRSVQTDKNSFRKDK